MAALRRLAFVRRAFAAACVMFGTDYRGLGALGRVVRRVQRFGGMEDHAMTMKQTTITVRHALTPRGQRTVTVERDSVEIFHTHDYLSQHETAKLACNLMQYQEDALLDRLSRWHEATDLYLEETAAAALNMLVAMIEDVRAVQALRVAEIAERASAVVDLPGGRRTPDDAGGAS